MRALATLSVFLALPALAADGDLVEANIVAAGQLGTSHYVWKLCDADTTNGTCQEWDWITKLGAIPDVWGVSIETQADCSATPQLAVEQRTTSGGTAFGSVTLSDDTSLDAIWISTTRSKRYVKSTRSAMTDCTDFTAYIEAWLTRS